MTEIVLIVIISSINGVSIPQLDWRFAIFISTALQQMAKMNCLNLSKGLSARQSWKSCFFKMFLIFFE